MKKMRSEQTAQPRHATHQKGMTLRSASTRGLTRQNMVVSFPEEATLAVVDTANELFESNETPMEVDSDTVPVEDEVGASRSSCLDEVDNL